MALLGWNASALARAAGLSVMTVTRFLRAQVQTAKTAKKLADALGHSVDRYLRSDAEAVAS